MSYPWLQERLNQGTLSLTGWYFDFEKGDLMAYNHDSGHFETLAAAQLVGTRTSIVRRQDSLGLVLPHHKVQQDPISEDV